MGLARSAYYDEPSGSQPFSEARLVERIGEIAAEWPSYGYRRVTAELHAEGGRVNHKKVMRLMKENGLSVRPRRPFSKSGLLAIFRTRKLRSFRLGFRHGDLRAYAARPSKCDLTIKRVALFYGGNDLQQREMIAAGFKHRGAVILDGN